MSGAGELPGRGVDAGLEAQGVDMVGQRLHVREALVGIHFAGLVAGLAQ